MKCLSKLNDIGRGAVAQGIVETTEILVLDEPQPPACL